MFSFQVVLTAIPRPWVLGGLHCENRCPEVPVTLNSEPKAAKKLKILAMKKYLFCWGKSGNFDMESSYYYLWKYLHFPLQILSKLGLGLWCLSAQQWGREARTEVAEEEGCEWCFPRQGSSMSQTQKTRNSGFAVWSFGKPSWFSIRS